MRVARFTVVVALAATAVGCRIGFDPLATDDAAAPIDGAADVDAPGTPGSFCTEPAQCDTGICSDGRCCVSACVAACSACNESGSCEPAVGTLVLSEQPDRSGAVRLDGQTVSPVAFVVVEECTGLDAVTFRVDDPAALSLNVEDNAPWDLVGTAPSDEPRPLLAGMLPAGDHILMATCETADGRTETIAANVTVPITAPGIKLALTADRVGAVALAEQTLAGDVFVFFVDVFAPFDRTVEFYLDDPLAEGSPLHTETSAPFDLVGGVTAAEPFDTTALVDGSHTLTVVADDMQGDVVTATSRFTVANP